jgi:hypothetical protein
VKVKDLPQLIPSSKKVYKTPKVKAVGTVKIIVLKSGSSTGGFGSFG